jgi:hypothetical protein
MNDLLPVMLANGMAAFLTTMYSLFGLGAALAVLSLALIAFKKTRRLALFSSGALLMVALFLAVWSRCYLAVPAAIMAGVAIPLIVLALRSGSPR